MTNNVGPDKIVSYEASHLDLHCLQKYLFWSSRLIGIHNEPSRQYLRCLTFSLSTFYINFFLNDSSLKRRKKKE